MKYRFLLVFIALIVSMHVDAQRISFYAEDLHFNLNEDIFEVDGLYYFRNLTDREVKQMLFYPFPDIEKYGEVSYIHVHPENDTTSMLATLSDKGSMFRLQIPRGSEMAYRIAYGQEVKNNRAKYIITTTQQWGSPFESAKYTLTFPEIIKMDSLSIPPDSVAIEDGLTTYFWKRKDFMPATDFEFYFKTK